eukprot:TRINITY_DN881_c0_g2_i1.p1 TRINITY_DN881_c0_g2~~TRINITY_DN881_c0_g2_i1.p1  ORF type:complete len:299 (+),score=36.12 TRINITY_DN881_c0_g2_i1:300-1196(+)
MASATCSLPADNTFAHFIGDTRRPVPSIPYKSHSEQVECNKKLCTEVPGCAFTVQANELAMLARNFCVEYLFAMGEGSVGECFNKWLSDDIEWRSKGMPVPIYALGKENSVRAYNIILERVFGGPTSQVTYFLDGIKVLDFDRVRVETTSSIQKQGELAPFIQRKSLFMRFRNCQICEMLVMPGPNHVQTISMSDACIKPISADDESSSSVSSKPSESSTNSLPPCDHNNWDSVRVKRQIALLRCRECSSQWKMKASSVMRCIPYMDGTCDGQCGMLHVNARKQTQEERLAAAVSDVM